MAATSLPMLVLLAVVEQCLWETPGRTLLLVVVAVLAHRLALQDCLVVELAILQLAKVPPEMVL
jgi:hypothetical protein